MTSFVTLERAVAQLRLDSSDDEDLVQDYIDTAEEAVSEYLQRPLVPWSTTQNDPPRAVQMAILMHVTDLYENRSAQTTGSLSLNPTVDRLLYPHRLGLGM